MPTNIAVITESAGVGASEAARMAAAIQAQVTEDFTPVWEIAASVSFFASQSDVPPDYGRIMIVDVLPNPCAEGYHLDNNNIPYAYVTSLGPVSLELSHECLEMLVDPKGTYTVPGASLSPGQGQVQFLVEVCDPCQYADNAYFKNGYQVSDFYTPAYIQAGAANGPFSFNKRIAAPLQVLPFGYLSWFSADGHLWQAIADAGGNQQIVDQGLPTANVALREWVDMTTTPQLRKRFGRKLRAGRKGVLRSHARAAQTRARAFLRHVAKQRRK